MTELSFMGEQLITSFVLTRLGDSADVSSVLCQGLQSMHLSCCLSQTSQTWKTRSLKIHSVFIVFLFILSA